MKYLITLYILSLSFLAHATKDHTKYTEQRCQTLFQDAYFELNELSERFNARDLNDTEFAYEVVQLSSSIRSGKYICKGILSDSELICMDLHERRYETLRNEISLTDILRGQQTEVSNEMLEYLNSSFLFEFEKVRCEGLF